MNNSDSLHTKRNSWDVAVMPVQGLCLIFAFSLFSGVGIKEGDLDDTDRLTGTGGEKKNSCLAGECVPDESMRRSHIKEDKEKKGMKRVMHSQVDANQATLNVTNLTD